LSELPGAEPAAAADAGPAAPRAAALFESFDKQLGWCRELGSPFMVHLLGCSVRLLQRDAVARALLDHPDPLSGLLPLRWAAALHDLALQGKAPWAALWAEPGSAGDEALDAALSAAVAHEREHLASYLAHAPQTNEVQRSAALLPGLLMVAQAVHQPLRLIELGASAGLNLWCDRWFHDMGAWHWGDAASPVRLSGQWRGSVPVLPEALNIVARAGCDLAPIDLHDAAQRRRLQAYVWADQAARLVRLQAALQAAAELHARHALVIESSNALVFAERQLAQPQVGQTQVIMHSIFWRYLDESTRAALQATIVSAGQRATVDAPLAWLNMEQPQPDAQAELRCRLWPGGADTLLARVHPHGNWVEWCRAEPLTLGVSAA
jgi:hypothetical protein